MQYIHIEKVVKHTWQNAALFTEIKTVINNEMQFKYEKKLMAHMTK